MQSFRFTPTQPSRAAVRALQDEFPLDSGERGVPKGDRRTREDGRVRQRLPSRRHDPSILGTLRLRLDSDIFAAARKTLDDDPRIPQNVRVHVDRGTVTLTGTVRWPHEKSDVEAVVRQIVGGLRVVHHIAVAEMLNPDAFEIPDPR